MDTAILTGKTQETLTYLERRMNQLEETILGLSPAFCPIYGTIDFTQETPEGFQSPYAMHTMLIPPTTLSVTFIPTPPRLTIGSPDLNNHGPLHWEHILEIEFPVNTNFVSFRYGGATGEMAWFTTNGSRYDLPALPALTTPTEIGNFYLVKNEGIHRIKITSNGQMFLENLAIGVLAHTVST